MDEIYSVFFLSMVFCVLEPDTLWMDGFFAVLM